ncbi:PhoH family protein [Clostridium aminobutyricum]|uniref:PhoH family protein n=1 Tax=Clostridium aminobutyricum TaxID=33953 RepID=A0A939D7Z0_CLOAM|nr:PhoH family protein [Clostridium aminobutyricum]MBN7772801.1 PhoH family protein [Clostridium aminobutyricum]
MIKNYILDTNVLIHFPGCIHTFEDNNIIIPLVCLEELDNLKKKEGILGYQAREAIREINQVRQYGNIHNGVTLPNGGTLRVELNHMNPVELPDAMDLNKNDNKILTVAMNIMNESQPIPTILVTKDLCVAIKAESLNLSVQDYQNDKIDVDQSFKGYKEITLTSGQIDKIYQGGLKLTKKTGLNAYPNEFFCIRSSDRDSHETLAKFDGHKIVPLKYANDKAWGLSPKNREQRMAFELLMDEELHLVTLSGGAGTGKSILSVAAALQKVLENNVYDKIILVKPVVSAGNAIGYLPGTEDAKLKPFMDSFGDAIESLMSERQKKNAAAKNDKLSKNAKKRMDYTEKPNFSVESFLEQYKDAGVIEMKTFAFMRGRTLSNAMVIIDEAQEMTPHLAKLMLTRAGLNSKFIMIGDPSDNQIDNTLVDSKSNGLVYVIEKMKPYEITGHVTLEEVERSPLARIAEECL